MTSKEKMMTISEKLSSKLLGMTGTDKAMTFVLEDKQVVIENYGSKSVDEIIEEIKAELNQ